MEHTILNRGRRTSLKNFEQELIKNGLLKLNEFTINLKNKSLKTFIIHFLKKYNSLYATVFIKNNNEIVIQTFPGRRRSGGDIFRICKFYYPDCTLEQVLMILDDLHGEENIISSICSQINKRVYRSSSYENGFIHNRLAKDEFNRKPGDYLNN